MNWHAIQDQWPDSWHEALEAALDQHAEAIEGDPDAYRPRVRGWFDLMNRSRSVLEECRELLGRLPEPDQVATAPGIKRLLDEHQALLAGIQVDAEPDRPGVAGVPLLAVAGLVLGVAAIAWAVASFTHATAHLVRAQTTRDELWARIRIQEQRGGPLAPSTLPPEPTKDEGSSGSWLLGGLALATAAIALPVFLTGKGAV